MLKSFAMVEYQGLYQLYYKKTGYCLSSSPEYGKVITTLKRLVKKYKTPQRLESALKELLDQGEVAEKQRAWVENLFEQGAKDYDHYVMRAVQEALEEAKKDTPFHRVKKKNKTSLIRKDHKPKVSPKEEKVTTKLVRSKPLRHRKLLKITE